MGSHIVQLLADKGYTVYVTSRSEKQDASHIKYIRGDAQDLKFLKQVLEDSWDAIIDFMNYSTDTFKKRINHLLDSTGHYIYLSSARVYANSLSPITEESPRLLDVSTDETFLSTDEYALAKARQENLLFASENKNWTIIRPYITYSEQRLQLGVLEKEAWLYRALKSRTIAFSQDIYSKYTTLTHGLDVARAIVSLIGVDSAKAQAFHITQPKCIKWQEVLEIYESVLTSQLDTEPLIKLQSIEQFEQWHSATYQVKYDRLYDRRFDNSKIAKYIDINSFVDVHIELKKCIEQFLKKPYFFSINWRAEAIKDRQFGSRASLSEIDGLKQKVKYFIYRNNLK
jgi:nucleoside-diphosphate-sugar epimerase